MVLGSVAAGSSFHKREGHFSQYSHNLRVFSFAGFDRSPVVVFAGVVFGRSPARKALGFNVDAWMAKQQTYDGGVTWHGSEMQRSQPLVTLKIHTDAPVLEQSFDNILKKCLCALSLCSRTE